MQGKLRRHELADPSVFTAKVEKLMAPGANVKGKTAGKPARRPHEESRTTVHAEKGHADRAT